MRKIYTLTLILLCLFNSEVLCQQTDVLESNNIRARVWNDGDLFGDKSGNPAFEYPAWTGKHANNLNGLWIIGKDSADNMVGAVTYKRTSPFSNRDFYPGPLDTTCSENVDANTMALYDHVWKVSRQEIALFRLCSCFDPGNSLCTGYTIPASIMEWPGNPIPELDGDHQRMDNYLAPFWDDNGDGTYNPLDCDFPFIRGDQGIFWVMNDQGGPHSVSGLDPMNIEIRCMAYATHCNDNYLDNTIFIDYEIIPRCNKNIHDLFIGMYSEANSGDANDDFVGTIANDNIIFHYNGDNNDGVYGSNTVAVGTDLVHGPLMRHNGVDDTYSLSEIMSLTDTTTASGAYGLNGLWFGDGIVDYEYLGFTRTIAWYDNEPMVNGNPQLAQHFYNYQRGFFKDGARMVYGGDGYPGPGMTVAADFIYPGTSDPDQVGTSGAIFPFNWTEVNNGTIPNLPGNRKTLASTGPIDLVSNAGRIKLTYAFFVSPSSPGDSTGALNLSIMKDSLRQYSIFADPFVLEYNLTSGYPNVLCDPVDEFIVGLEEDLSDQIAIFPNPTRGITHIFIPGDYEKIKLDVYSISGKLLQSSVFPSAGESFIKELDINFLPSGVYLVQVNLNGHESIVKKLIKN